MRRGPALQKEPSLAGQAGPRRDPGPASCQLCDGRAVPSAPRRHGHADSWKEGCWDPEPEEVCG